MNHYMKTQTWQEALRVLYRHYVVVFAFVMGIIVSGCTTNGYYLDAPNVARTEDRRTFTIESVSWGTSFGSDDSKLLAKCFGPSMKQAFKTNEASPLRGGLNRMPVSVSVGCATQHEKVSDNAEPWLRLGCGFTLGLWPISEEAKYEFVVRIDTPYRTMFRDFSINHKARTSAVPYPFFTADTTITAEVPDGPRREHGFVGMPSGGNSVFLSYHAPQNLIEKGIATVLQDLELKEEGERYVAQMQKISSLRREGKWESVIEEAKNLNTQHAVNLKKEALDNIEARRVAAKVDEIKALCERGEWNAVLASCEGEKGDKFDQFRKRAKAEIEGKRVEEKLARIRELEKKEEWSAVLLECKGESDPRIKDYAVIAKSIVMKNASAALWSRFELLASGSKKRMQKEELWKKFFRGKRLLLKGVFDDADDAVVLKVGNGRIRLHLINEERPKVVDLEPGTETWFSGMLSDWDCDSASVTMQYGRLGDENVRAGSSRTLGDIFSSSGGSDILGKALMGGLMGEDAGEIFLDELFKAAVRTGAEVYNMSDEERDDMFDDAAEGLNGLGEVLDALFK